MVASLRSGWTNGVRSRKILISSIVLNLLLLIALPVQAGSLISRVDRQEVSAGETLTLTVSLDQQVLFGEPDFGSLEKDFDILSRNRQSRFSNNNGKKESYTQWLLTLSPKKTGMLIIPSFNFKGEISDAMKINVTRASPGSSAGAEIFTEAKLEKNAVYVQEQALLTLRLFTAVPLSNFEMGPLDIPNAQVIKLSENQYQKRANNKDYIVVENQFAIFAENSGQLTIPSVRYSGIAKINYDRKRVALGTEEQVLSVKPRPNGAMTTTWLPARGASLSDNWGRDKPTMTVGEPVTRTITLSAEGLTAAQLPPLQIEQDQYFKLYNDQPQLEDNTSAQGLSGHRIESMAIVPTQSGPLTFPEIQVQWWDTVNDRLQTAILPSETFQVLPGAEQAMTTQPNAALTPTNESSTRASPGLSAQNSSTVVALLVSNAFLGLLGITFAILWWRERKAQQRVTTNKPAPTTARATLKPVRLAAADSDFSNLREAIIQWARNHWQERGIHTLEQVAVKAENAELKLLFQQLDRHLYNKGGSGMSVDDNQNTLDTGTLVKHLEAIQQAPTNSKKTKLTELQPLYPE